MKSNPNRSAGHRSTGRAARQSELFATAVDSPAVTKFDWLTQTQGCRIVDVGKRRDGGTRYWCLQHKADATAKYGKPAGECRAARIPPLDPRDILRLDLDKYRGGIALWGAVPAVYDTTRLPMDRGIHVHARPRPDSKKEMDATFRAVCILGKQLPKEGVVVAEIDAIYYMASSVFGYPMKHVACTYCGWSHLDKDWFSVHPHQRHLCAGCGRHFRDTERGVGNPIMAIREACGAEELKPAATKRKLDIRQRDYPGGVQIWGSNAAFLWTGKHAEDEGIHVHAFAKDGEHPVVDETYGRVLIDGVELDAQMVRVLMAQRAMPSIQDRVVSLGCPKCRRAIFDTDEAAFTPTVEHKCSSCRTTFPARGRLRKTIANPLPEILSKLAAAAPRPPQNHRLELMPETL